MIELNILAKPKNLFPPSLIGYLIQKIQVGSRAICNPPPTDTDDDWLCYIVKKQEVCEMLEAEGWKRDENYALEEIFVSYKQEGNNINLILTDNVEYFQHFKTAMLICKKFNVTNKQDRIWVHNKLANLV